MAEDRARGVVAAEARNEGDSVTAAESPSPISTSLTPAGIEIAYYLEPKRMYRIAHEAAEEWEEVPSVTTVLDILGKGALPWWGMKIGVQGLMDLFSRGVVKPAIAKDGTPVIACLGRRSDGSSGAVVADVKRIVKLLQDFRLTVNDVKSDAGDRGQSVHDALEIWARERIMPQPLDYPEHEQGYVEGLWMFLDKMEQAEAEVLYSEQMVGSAVHGYAGRGDIKVRTHRDVEIVSRWYPKRKPKVTMLHPGDYFFDLKTTPNVYETHAIQLEAYELASVEDGYPPTDARGVIRVHPGDPEHDKLPDVPHYEVVKSWAVPEDFLAVLHAYNTLQDMKGRK